ncbi:MAG TPA: bacillithiol biosynthesis cysteine-adding enzyme BshC [Pyrinomonadaceae bacterium]
MNQNSISHCFSNNYSFQIESLPFAELKGQSRIFIEYQQNPLSLKKYYPNVVESHSAIAQRIPEILENHKVDRNLLCDALTDMNEACSATGKTLENIELLRDPECVAVVSGQQAGLFSGPLYTIYKALSAIKMTECLRGRGFKAVPVFWIATEDHDFAEVSKTFVLGRGGELGELRSEPKRCYENLPVGYVKLDESIEETVNELFESLNVTEYTEELKRIIEEAWRPEIYFGDAFVKLLTKLFGKYGLIFLCPLNKRLKKLAAPVYVEAIRKSGEIVEALRERSAELVADGYHAQVLIGEDYFPLFWQARDNTRNALKKSADGKFRTKDNSREFTIEELAEIAEREPQRFSPSVVLRSVVQDYLLPTACYFGGAAEIAYFAQSSEVYRILNRPQTSILHRQSFTVVESRHRRTMEKYDLSLPDLFKGEDNLATKIVEQFLNSDTARLFAGAEEKINLELNRLDQNLSQIEPTLAENLAKRRRKILYHIGAMRHKFHLAQMRRDDTVRRRIETMLAALLPAAHLQERTLNVSYFLNRYGLNFIDWLYDAIDLDDKSHRVLYL